MSSFRLAAGDEERAAAYVDRSGKYSLKDIQTLPLQNWQSARTIRAGYIEHPLWLKMEFVQPAGPSVETRYFRFTVRMDSVVLYHVRPDGMVTEIRAGRRVSLVYDPFPSVTTVLPLNILPGKNLFYLCLTSQGTVNPEFFFQDHHGLMRGLVSTASSVSAAAGILLIMFLYNLILFIWIRDWPFLAYSLFVLGLMLNLLDIYGFLRIIVHELFGAKYLPLSPLLVPLVTAALIFYLLSFFAEKIRRKFQIYGGIIAIANIGVMVSLFAQDNYRTATVWSARVFIAVLVAGIFMSIHYFRHNYRPSRFIVIGFVFSALMVLGIVLLHFDLVPLNYASEFVLIAGVAGDTAFFSIALSDRYNILRREREEALLAAERVRIKTELETKDRIFGDLHDLLGARLTDAEIALRAKGGADRKEMLGRVIGIQSALREKLSEIDMLVNRSNDFSLSLQEEVLRRYVASQRQVRFTITPEVERWLNAPGRRIAHSQLIRIATEITTNDLKYGVGIAEWRFAAAAGGLVIEFASQVSRRKSTSRRLGFGRGILQKRLQAIGAKMHEKIADGRYELRIMLAVRT